MVKLINRITGGGMWVAEERVDEYIAAGHKLDADAQQSQSTKANPKKRKAKK